MLSPHRKYKQDYREYNLKPIVIDAKLAHQKDRVKYDDQGTIILHHSDLYLGNVEHKIALSQQYNTIRATFDDLNKALSSLSNSPLIQGKKTLRQQFDGELERYEFLVEETVKKGKWEPDYGTYVFDKRSGEMYLIAPEFWHRLGLVTNSAKLISDVKGQLTWREIRSRFDQATIGFIGVSVGGNILEGVMREIRPKKVKIADPDWVELTNLNRFERGSLRHLVQPKSIRSDPKNPYDIPRLNKAEAIAHELHLVDPYAEIFVYHDGIHSGNIKQFILGDGKSEPGVDILVEECDDFRLKIDVRDFSRKYKIPVLMISDFGHQIQIQFQDFRHKPQQPLGHLVSDENLLERLDVALTSGKREDRFDFVRALCGSDFEKDEFGEWVKGRGEQPTSSLPQSGATAMVSGGLGGKLLAFYLLGYTIPENFIYDLRERKIKITSK